MCKFSENIPHFSTAMTEECSASLAEEGVLVAKTVTDTNNKVGPLRLLNVNSFPTKLYRNETAAACDQVAVVEGNPQSETEYQEQIYSLHIETSNDVPLPEHLR